MNILLLHPVALICIVGGRKSLRENGIKRAALVCEARNKEKERN
jgi:hypothetical protein